VRDVGSTNGTYVNGTRVVGDVELKKGDKIAFGSEGPLVEFGVSSGETPSEVIRARLAKENRRLRWMAAGVGIAGIVVAMILVVTTNRARAEWERERGGLIARIDSVLDQSDAAVTSLQGQVEGLAQALRTSQDEVRMTRAGLEQAAAANDGAAVDQLRQQLRSATEALSRQQLAASLDFRAIESANRHAITQIFVESEDGTVATGTGFAVRPDATIVTAGHLVAGADRTRRPRRIAVQFSDSEQYFPARVLAVSDEADLAVIRADNIAGGVPVIRGFNQRADTLADGTPIAVIGFPRGGETGMPGSANERVARPLISAAIVTDNDGTNLEARGYGAAGASGSPVFDATGRVAAILYGGRDAPDGHTLVAVRADAARKLLDSVR
jgi:S1-C subfamily serine protease